MEKKQRSGGAAPYGYRRNEKGDFELDSNEAPIRKLIFELFLRHKRKLTIANELNNRGYLTRSGAKFSDSSIERFLNDPIVIGHHKANFIPSSGDKIFTRLKPESEWKHPPLEPIIENSVWYQAHDILNGQRNKRITKKPASLFAEFLYCNCGAKMHRPHGRRNYSCSQCENSIEAETLETIFGTKLEAFSINKKLLENIYSENSNSENQKEQQAILLKQKDQLEDELEKLYGLFISSSISKQRFDEKNATIEGRLNSINNTLEDVRQLANSEEVKNLAQEKNVGSLWSKLPTSKQRQIVELYTQRIDVGSTNIKIALLYPPS